MGKISSYPAAGSVSPDDVLIGNHDGVTSTFGPAALAAAFTAPAVPAPSRLLNGWFDVWQAGTSFTADNTKIYAADQWVIGSGHASNTVTMSRQAFAKGQITVPGDPTYFARVQRNVTTGSGSVTAEAVIEGAAAYANGTVTVPVRLRGSEAMTLTPTWVQKFGSGGSPSSDVTTAATHVDGTAATTITLTTSWQRFLVRFPVPSAAAKTFGSNGDDSVRIQLAWPSASGSADAYFDIATMGVFQSAVDLGDARPNMLDHYAKCQRHYFVMPGLAVQGGIATGAYAATQRFPPMRKIPSASIGSPAAQSGVTTITVEYITTQSATIYLSTAGGAAYYNDFTLTLDSRIAA